MRRGVVRQVQRPDILVTGEDTLGFLLEAGQEFSCISNVEVTNIFLTF